MMKTLCRAKHTKKQKVRLPLSAYFTYLLIATLLVTGISFSRFASTGGTDDGARVAVVGVDGGSNDTNTSLALGEGEESAAYNFYITNSNVSGLVSEVPLDYTVSIKMPEGKELPEGVKMSLACSYDVYDSEGTWLERATVDDCSHISTENGVYTFAGGTDFAAGKWEQHDYTLTFTVTDESLITEDYSFTGIEISVKAEQID